MKRRRIRLEVATAVAASIVIHAIVVWGLIFHNPAPALASEQAMIVSLVEAPPQPEPPSSAARAPSHARDRRPVSAARPVSPPRAQSNGPTASAEVTPAPIAASAPLPSPSLRSAAPRPTAPSPTVVSKPPADPLIEFRRRVWAHLAARAPSAPPGSGVTRVMFGLDESGMVLFVRLVRSSGHPTFDRACLTSVRAAQPFPSPPPGISRGSLVFEVPITAADRAERP